MTDIPTPKNAPRDDRKPDSCAAWGCPCPGTSKTGSDWMCGYHVRALPAHWQAITTRLNLRQPILTAINWAEHLKPADWKRLQEGAAARMRQNGREDLVPKIIRRPRQVWNRSIGKFEDGVQVINELEFAGMWAARLKAVVFAECSGAVPAPVQPQTQAAGEMPQTVGSLFPTMSSVAQFVTDEVEA